VIVRYNESHWQAFKFVSDG